MAEGAYIITDDGNEPRNFHMDPVPGKDVPEDQQTLNIAIQKVFNTVDLLYPGDNTAETQMFKATRDELMGISRVGLTGAMAQTGLATRALESLKADLVIREAGRVKNRYMQRLGIWAVLSALPAAIAFALLVFCVPAPEASREALQESRQALLKQAQKFQDTAKNGKPAAAALGGKVGELMAGVEAMDENARAVAAKADELDQATKKPAADLRPLADEARKITDRTRELTGVALSGGPDNRWARTLSCFALLWLGCMGGVWLSFGYRKTVFQFDDLVVIETDRLEPAVRLIYAGLLTLLIGLFFCMKVLTIEVGEVSTAQIASDRMIALILGMVCGFSELVLGTKVAQRAASFLDWK